MHVLACFAPMTFSWPMVWLFFVTYLVSRIGINLSYHTQLSHRSFRTPKWLEYAFAYCGVSAAQGDPAEWVSNHRHHHRHCDTPLDVHSPREGFWWAHMGWLFYHKINMERVGDRSNAMDMYKDPFYRHLGRRWRLHIGLQLALLYALGGFPALVWGGGLRIVLMHHITFIVNSAGHMWGNQTYKTGDSSRNSWLLGILTAGDGWHNNHHAFEWSARHGLEWWQIDISWQIIRLLEACGLATNVKFPSEKQKARLAL